MTDTGDDPVDPTAATDGGTDRAAATARSLGAAVRRLWTESRRDALSMLALAVGLLVFVAHLPGFVGRAGAGPVAATLFAHLWTLALLLVLGALTRTVALRTLVSYWLVGVFLVTTVAFGVTDLAAAVVGTGWARTAVVVPVVEETLKALPVGAYLWLSVRSGNWERTATDGLLVGFSVGAGFGLYEAVAKGGTAGPLVEAATLGSPWWGWLFPFANGFLYGTTVRWWASHPAWTALVGLALGAALAYRHRRRAWLLPLAAWLLATLDHAAVNNPGLDAIDRLLALGELTVAVLAVGVFAAVALDLARLRRPARRYAEFFPGLSVGWIRAILGGPFTLWELKAAENYARWRRSGLLAVRRWTHVRDDPEPPETTVQWLTTMRAAAEPLEGEWWGERRDRPADD